ncbi:MAG: hypothetical protein V3576_03010 [Candidatus Cloacimonadota bacterium]
MKSRTLLLPVILLLWSVCLCGQISQELVGVDSLTVGSRFKLIIKADFAINKLVIPDSLSEFAVLESFRNTKDEAVPFIELTIVPLKTGSLSFPQLKVEPVINSATEVYTDRFRVNVLSVRPENDDKLRDIKDPKRYRWQKVWWIYLLALILALAALIYLVIDKLKAKSKPLRIEKAEAQERKPIVLQPWELALQSLEKLLSLHLLQRGEGVEFHFRLAQILRSYLEQVYHLPALEMTTREISKALVDLKLSNVSEIRSFLQDCDLIKFAKQDHDETSTEARIAWLKDYLKRQNPLYHRVSTQEVKDSDPTG